MSHSDLLYYTIGVLYKPNVLSFYYHSDRFSSPLYYCFILMCHYFIIISIFCAIIILYKPIILSFYYHSDRFLALCALVLF